MADMNPQYEYVVVELPTTPWKARDRDTTTAINAVAEHGWRLVGMQPQYDALSKPYGIFEREASNG